MPFFRKKPIVISAQKIPALENQNTELYEKWFIDAIIKGDLVATPDGKITVKTLEGEMTGSPGDYIIKGVQGELYPCQREIFISTYESEE